MQQTSKLSIVVDTSNAKQRLSDFTKQLNDVTKAATNMAEKVEKSLSAKGSQGASSQISSLTRETNLLGTAAQQAALMQDRLTTSAAKTATAQANATKAAANAATAQNRQAASANSVTISNNSLAQSEFAVERAMNKTIATETRLQIIQNSLAGSALRLGTAQQNAAISATLGQDKLAASTHRVAAAASAANLASSKFVISQHNEAAAALRTTTQLSRLATEQQRTAAATSAAAGAATRAQINLNGLAASAVRVQREEARLQAELLRTNALAERQAAAAARAAAGLNGMGNAADRANHASRGLHGSMNKLYTVLNSGLVAVTGLGFIKTAAEMQNLNNQIRLVTDSEHEYLLMKQLAGKIADDNFADINSTISLYQKSVRALENLGKSQADSIKFTEAVSLAMRTGGRSAGENAAAILQLGQAMGAGVIMGDEFRSISENAPILLKLVAKEMGVLQGDLKKLSADGKITAEIMYNAMTKNMAELEELAKKMPLTMGQAFVVAKNNYKKYTDEMMNSTGGVSDKISGMLVKISANFDTIAKVGIAAVSVGLLSIVANLATATKAMALFNLVASANPLILIVSGFLLINSAIFDVNEVLTISGIMLGDFFDGMLTMLKDGETWWMDFSNTVAVAMGLTVKEVAEANDKNSKNFLGFYEQTEKGFAGVVQGLGTAIGSVTAIFGTFFELLGRWTDNMFTIFENMGKAAYNAGNRVRMLFGGDNQQQEYGSLKSLDGWSIYKDTFNSNQDAVRGYAQSLNKRKDPPVPFGQYDPNAPLKQNMVNQNFFSVDMTNFMKKGVGSGVLARTAKSPTQKENPLLYNPQANRFPSAAGENAIIQKGVSDLKAAEEELAKTRKKSEAELKKQASSTELVRLAVLGGKNWGVTGNGGAYGASRDGGSRSHNGIDIPVGKGHQVYAPEAGTITTRGSNATGGGNTMVLTTDKGVKYTFMHLDSYDVKGGRVDAGMGIAKTGNSGTRKVGGGGYKDHLHLEVEVNGKKINPKDYKVGKTSYDNTIGSYNSKVQSEAEKQREKEAQEAEKRLQSRLKIDKEYATKRELISLQLNEKLLEIKDAGYDDETAIKRGEQAQAEANREMAIYEETFARRIDALDDFHQTERYKLQQERDNAVFDALHNQDLLQAGNEQYLKYEIEAANRLYNHKESLLNLSQEEEALGLFEYASTDRRMFEEGWRLKIARAKLATDELKDIRIKAYEAEYAKDQELFNLNEKKKRLELNSYKMSDTESMVAGIALEREGIALSNATPEQKREQSYAAGQPIRDTFEGMLNGFDNSGTAEGNPYLALEAQRAENIEKIKAYEQEIGLIEGDAREARLAEEREYYRAKAELVVNDGESIMGSLASIAKDTMGEQSSIFKAMFAMEKGFAIARSIMNIQVALSSAAASLPFPANLGAIATVAMEGASIISSLKAVAGAGFENGGYTGSMGTKDIAGVVHGQEYVFDAQSTKRIGVDNLNAMRKGQSVGGDVQVNIINNSSARVTSSDNGKTITITDVNNAVDRKFDSLSNPNSHASKAINRNIQAPRRR